MDFREHPLDGARLLFDRQRGMNVLLPGQLAKRQAPRVLQIGLLTPCNLACSFCYRDQSAPSRLTSEFLVELLRGAADWGVLEVAFGGGEPLFFRGFPELVQELHNTTPLGINFTTNGTLLTPEVLGQLAGAVSEIRVSAYPDNHYRRTLQAMAGWNFGVNWLVTPANVGLVEPTVRDFFDLGARNVLLLGYKGFDQSLHLGDQGLNRLRSAVLNLQPRPIRLDICWYPRFPDLPHLFSRPDCGAGDEFLVITPDQAVQPCSFHHERIPFETLDDLKRIYSELRARKPAAAIAGCTRTQFVPLEPTPRGAKGDAYVWSAHSSNNSGDWTIVGEFKTAEEARKAAESLRELARSHEAFLASPAGQAWLEKNEYYGNIPSPPIRAFGEAHGFRWEKDGEGLWWEEDGAGAPVLTAGAVGKTVVIYHPYCMGLPKGAFKRFFQRVGAHAFGDWQYEVPTVVAKATGSNPKAMKALRSYLEEVKAADHPFSVKKAPPWGEKAQDPRIEEDEDRDTRLQRGDYKIQETNDRVTISISFANTFAGSLALEQWLRALGYRDIEIGVVGELTEITALKNPIEPRTGFLPNRESLSKRIAKTPLEDLATTLFEYANIPQPLLQAIEKIPAKELVQRCLTRWKQLVTEKKDVTDATVFLLKRFGREAEPWARAWVAQLEVDRFIPYPAAMGALAALPPDEAFGVASNWVSRQKSDEDRKKYLKAMGPLKHPKVLDLIEEQWRDAPPQRSIHADWPVLAAESQLPWERAKRWIESGRPMSIIALEGIAQYLPDEVPSSYGKPSKAEFLSTLESCLKKDSAPRVEDVVKHLMGCVYLTNEWAGV